jgi:glycosyltransferase involved in cell wall biosynthesis
MTTSGNKRKIYYVVSHVHKSLAFEWIALRLKKYYDVTFVLLNDRDTPFEAFLQRNNISVIRFNYSDKRNLPKVFVNLLWLFAKDRPYAVHAHLFDATLIGLTAAWMAGIKKRIYTRHNSTFHHLYHPDAVKFDRWTNFLATHIISISQATDEALINLEGVSVNKIVKIPHGFDFADFKLVDENRITSVQQKWKLPSSTLRIGVVARHIEWKGIQYIIQAFQRLLENHPNACLIMANATGPYHQTILELLKSIPEKNLVLIPFEEDVAALYKSFDLYIHTPIDSTCEAFGQTYIEALASGLPSIFTLSGIAKEFIEHKKNAWVVDFRDADGILKGMEAIWNDQALKERLTENGRQSVFSQFEIEGMITGLRQLYDK